MLKVGTYNAIMSPNEYYDPTKSDFASSHKTFKRMMPTFAWEVLEVYSGPPVVAFKWRHWGVMKNDYVGFNNKGVKVRAKAHGSSSLIPVIFTSLKRVEKDWHNKGGPIDIQGITIAKVDDKVRLQGVETWFDPMEMFRQIAPTGEVQETPIIPETEKDLSSQLDDDQETGVETAHGDASISNVEAGAAACPFLASQ
jgi:hypothetical protein